jgi:hypothetical protein
MSKILTVIYAAVACLPLSLSLAAISCPTDSHAVGHVGCTELSIFRDGPDCRDRDLAEATTDDSASIYGDEDSDADKNEKDEKDEDPGQIRLWDSVLLG